MSLQLFAALDPATEKALTASIERFGVIVPVVKDQDGRIIDGHHRDRIATTLGVKYVTDVREVAGDGDATELARTLNADRRHLTPEQRRPVVAALREGGHSIRAIAGALGVSKGSIESDLEGVLTRTPEQITGQDGKNYPAKQPKSEAEPKTGKRSIRKSANKNKPYVAETAGQKQRAEAQKRKIVDGLSEIGGTVRGLLEIDYGIAAAALSPDDIRTWIKKAQESSEGLKQVATTLKEVSRAE